MAYDKTWTFSLNNTPVSQLTLAAQGQSFFYFLKNKLIAAGWSVIQSVSNALLASVPSALPVGLCNHMAVTLADGRILVIGGFTANTSTSPTATTYFGTVSGSTISWVSGTAYPGTITQGTVTLLGDGRILVVGGLFNGANSTNTYFGTISGNSITWAAGTALPAATYTHTTNLLSDGRILIIGGIISGAASNVTRFGTISGNTITWATGTVYTGTDNSHTATILPDGRVLVIGGTYNGGSGVTTTYFGTISTNTITWAAGTVAPYALHVHATTLLADGRIMITGGYHNNVAQDLGILFGTIASNTITWANAAGNYPGLPQIRYNHYCVLAGSYYWIIGGAFSNAVSQYECWPFTISSTTTTWTLPAIPTTDSWTDQTALNAPTYALKGPWVMLKSPVGMIAGPDGSYSGDQSRLGISIRVAATNLYQAEIRFYTLAQYSATNANDGCYGPPTGYAACAGVANILPSSLSNSKFHFAYTSEGGFWCGVSKDGGGFISTLIYCLPLKDVCKYGANDYPYAAIFGHWYDVAGAGSNWYTVFGPSAGNAYSFDGTVSTARLPMTLSSSSGNAVGTSGGAAGDINGDLLVASVYLYNNVTGKTALIGRLPDILATGVTLATGSTTPVGGPVTMSLIGGIWVPTNAALSL